MNIRCICQNKHCQRNNGYVDSIEHENAGDDDRDYDVQKRFCNV